MPISVDKLFRTVQQDFPEIGTITLKDVGANVVDSAEKLAADVPEAVKGNVFTNFLLSKLISEPSFSVEQIEGFTASTLSPLLETSADVMGFREDFDALPQDIANRERFYQAFRNYMSRTLASLQEAITGDMTKWVQSLNGSLLQPSHAKDIIGSDIFSKALSLNIPVQPIVFNALTASGINNPSIHTPTYSIPELKVTSVSTEQEKEDAIRQILKDGYDTVMQLERSLRILIEHNLRKSYGDDWWKKGVPDAIREGCEQRKREKEKQPAQNYHPI